MKKLYIAPLFIAGAALAPHDAMAQAGYAIYCAANNVGGSYTAGTFAPVACNLNGYLDAVISGALAAGTNTIGNVGIVASSTGGGSSQVLISAATNNATVVKATAGTLSAISALNTNSATGYLKIYNTATTPQCGTNVVQAEFPLVQNVAVSVPIPPAGVAFSNGISACITANQAITDNASATTGITVTFFYD